ncbi:MAG: UDP-N-acetylmuramate dehydrogenase [Candidatus Bipolaricaulota bacterium]
MRMVEHGRRGRNGILVKVRRSKERVTIVGAPKEVSPAQTDKLISRGVPLAPHTSLRVGGPARFYVCPTNGTQLATAITWATVNRSPYYVLGGGTNILFTDSGFDGLILHTARLRGLCVDGVTLRAAAGEALSAAVWAACRAGLTGLEWACGIPGTVGGAVVMNAGTEEGETASVLQRVTIHGPRGEERVPTAALALGYRTSALLTGDLSSVITEVEFTLRRDDPDACTTRARRTMAERIDRLPAGASVGCIFRNPPEGPTAGQLLDRSGCKKLRVGGAYVSDEHANVIVNERAANAGEILELIERMKFRVRDAYGIDLHEEVVIIH